MADFTLARPGLTVGGADNTSLFLKVFAGEVITTFNYANVMAALTMVRTISSGKSASFPVQGRLVASYHTPGTEMVGQAAKANEKIISIDGLLTAPVSIANIDEAMNHYDARSLYTTEVGRALSRQWDIRLIRTVIKAARASATLSTGYDGGYTSIDALAATSADNLKQKLRDCAQVLDEKNVPDEDRVAVLKPAQWHMLIADGEIMHRDFGGTGSIASGRISEYDGIRLVKSNNIPSDNYSAVTGEVNDYAADYRYTVCPVFHKSAVGTVKLLDLSTESEYSVAKQATLIVSKYAVGHGILRPEAACEIKTQ